MANLLQNLRALGQRRLMLLAAAGAGVLLAVALVAFGLSRAPMGVLYAGLDDAEAGRILTQLQSMKVPYQVSGTGGAILLPQDQIARTRMLLAQQGLPSAGGAGYELFDEQGALGLTSFMQRLNKARALEGELARTIQTLNGVKSARVHLSMPDGEAFAPGAAPAGASVVVRTVAGGLDRSQALAIRHLVAAAVPRLQPGAVTVMDASGVVLAADGGATDGLALLHAEELRSATETRLARAIEEMLVPRFGPGNIRVRVAAEIDLGRETLREQTFDPNSRVLRSTQTVEERESSVDRDTDQPTTVEQNLPLEAADAQAPQGSRSESSREEETANYEISSILRERAQDAGEIKRLAVAVVVNGSYVPGADGKGVYQPRSAEELARIEHLVRTAIGFDDRRGDMVAVENLQFLAEPEEPAAAPATEPGLVGNDMVRLLQWLVLGVVAVLVILLVLRPLVMRAKDAPAPAAAQAAAPPQLADATTPVAGQLTHEGSDLVPAGEDGSQEVDDIVDLRSVEGGVSAAALRRLAGIVDEHPEESITVLRTWIYEGAS